MRIKPPSKATLRIFAIAITAVMCTLVILSAVFPFPEGQWDFLSIGTSQKAYANPDWLTGWTYRKSHVINNATGAGTLYQKEITVHYETPDAIQVADLGGTANTRFNYIEKADIDSDGTTEFVLLRRIDGGNGYFDVYHFDGASYVFENTLQTTCHTPEMLKIEDIDGDNTKELVICGFDTNAWAVDIWSWNGTTYAKDYTTGNVGLGGVACWPLALSKLDGTNWKIIVGFWTSTTNYIRVYDNTLSSYNEYSWADTGRLLTTPLGVGDVDNDGIIEFLMSGRTGANAAFIKVFNWNITSNITLEQTITVSDYTWQEARGTLVYDIDGDSSQEIIMIGYEDSGSLYANSTAWLRIYANNFTSIEKNELWQYDSTSSWACLMQIYNFDGDALSEITINGYVDNQESFIKAYEWDGADLTTIFDIRLDIPSGADYAPVEYLAPYDFDGDGKIEMITAGYHHSPEKNHSVVLRYKSDGNDNDDDVYVDGHCRTDFGDVRFVDNDGATALDYLLIDKVDSDYAIFWVEVGDDLSSANQTIYVYYGHADETTTSNGPTTFPELYDTFSAWNSTTWGTQPGWATVADSLLKLKEAALTDGYIYSVNTVFSENECLMARVKALDTSYGGGGRYFSSTDKSTRYNSFYKSGSHGGYVDDEGGYEYVDFTTPTYNSFYNLEIGRKAATDVKFYIDTTLMGTASTRAPDGNMYVELENYDAKEVHYDWIIIRKYVYPEPAHSTWGAEETLDVAITNSPESKDFGILAVSTSSNTTITFFTITNTGNCNVDITIQGTNLTGGDDTWALSGNATPGENIYGLKAGLDDGSPAFDVVVNTTANAFISNLSEDATQAWGLNLTMPISVSGYDAQEMSATITLIASES